MRAAGSRQVLFALVIAAVLALALPHVSAQSQGSFVPPHSDRGVDTDGDGLFDVLRVDVHVDASVPGSFRLYASLYDGANTTSIDSGFAFRTISGPTVISIDFVGYVIRNSGITGPYTVNLELYDDAFNLDDWNQHMTQAYSPAQFQRSPATLAPPHSDAAEDRDAPPDGLYDVLRIDVRLNVSEAGIYTVSGLMWDPIRSSTIAVASRGAGLNPGMATVSLFFPGVSIRASGWDGPYPVDLYVFGFSTITDQGNYTTGAYAATQFAAPTARAFGGVLDESSNPIPFSSVDAYNYRDDLHFTAQADVFGGFSLDLYPGDWIFTFDDWDQHAQFQRTTLTAGSNFVGYAYLLPAPSDPVITNVTFASWSDVEDRSVDVGLADNATFRLVYDWELGNRDQSLTLDEWNRFQQFLGYLPAVAQDTRDAFLVDGTGYDLVAGSDVVSYPNLEGPIDSALSPQFQQSASYLSALLPSRSRSVVLNVTYDTRFANYAYFVRLPLFYALASFISPASVSVSDLGGGLVSIDPGSAPGPGEASTWITLVANTTDSIAPTITSTTVTPDPVEIHQSATITATVTDDHGVGAVNVEIRDPSGPSVGNFTMTHATGDSYEYAFSPPTVGTYAYQVTALDIGGNPAAASGSFVSRDTTPPLANAGPDQTAPQHTVVTLDGSGSSDNDRVANYTWTFEDAGPRTQYGVRPTYRFDRAGTFDVTLTVRDPSGNPASDSVQVIVTPTTGTIRGMVQDVTGTPLEGATVRLMSGSTEVARTTTNASGGFEFSDVAPGTFTLSVDLTGYDPKADAVSVVAGQTTVKDISLSRTATPSPISAWILPVGIGIAVLGVIIALAYGLRRRSRREDQSSAPKMGKKA